MTTNGLIFDKHLDPYLGGLRVGDLSPRRLDEWRRELEAAGASTYMLNRSKTLLGQILADARRLDFVAVNAARGLPTVRRRARRGKTAAPEQVEAMRASFLEGGHLGHATLISLLAYVGLRPREALDLCWEMVDRDRLILPADLTKGRMARSPDVPRPVIADLGRWRLACGALGGLVFPRPADGCRWTKVDWDNWRKRGFTKAAGNAGLRDWDTESESWVGDFRPYDLRHTCASLMIRAHVGPADVAAQLGTSLEPGRARHPPHDHVHSPGPTAPFGISADGGIGEVDDRGHDRAEALGEAVFEPLPPSPRGPSLLADLAVAVKDLCERQDLDLTVPTHVADRGDQLGPVDGVASREQVHVGEVPPARAHGAPGDGGHDLLGVDHRQRVAAHSEYAAEEARNAHTDRAQA